MSLLSKSFSSCNLSPVTKDKAGEPTTILPSPIGTWKTTSFFLDSSGRSSFALPLELTFSSEEDLSIFLASNCLTPAPQNVVEDQEESTQTDHGSQSSSSSSSSSTLGFEVKSYPVDDLKAVLVEGITILSTSVEGLSIYITTDLTVRASSQQWLTPESESRKLDARVPEKKSYDVDANLEITPVLIIKEGSKDQRRKLSGGVADDDDNVMELELNALQDRMLNNSRPRIQETRLSSINLDVTLTHAFTIAVKSIGGPSFGNTMVSLTLRHSNSHAEPVAITNIALHPGHSRQDTSFHMNRSIPGGQYSVTNMTKSVQWRYATNTELQLPLVLNPREAYSTVIVVDAGEEMRSRTFVSPVSVTGVVGKDSAADTAIPTTHRRQRLVVAAEAQWMTGLVAVEPADAFRIDMNVNQSECKLGETMVVSLRIFNLSLDRRDLMLLMAKDDPKEMTKKDEAVNTAVVSEVKGYTFGVWGVSGEDDGTVRLNRDRELLAVDAALLLGEVPGQHAVDAILRFIPLREGTLKVPNWKLYDKSAGRWYNCSHKLKIVAKANT